MKTLGTRTKSVIATIVATLPFLRAEGTAAPLAARDSVGQIKQKYAQDHVRSDGDPLDFAARAWVEEQLGNALESDEKEDADQKAKDEAAAADKAAADQAAKEKAAADQFAIDQKAAEQAARESSARQNTAAATAPASVGPIGIDALQSRPTRATVEPQK